MSGYEKFEALLHKNNITSYACAKATDISPMTLSDWKLGKSRPKADKLKKIADFFNVTIEELIDDEIVEGSWANDNSIQCRRSETASTKF